MTEKTREDRVSERLNKCKHFNGIQHNACEAGVNYHELLGTGAGCFAHMPCFSDEQSPAECRNRELFTPPESEAREREIEESIEQFLGRMRQHECDCGKSVESYKQAGHCVYREPCGHRLGQGDAKKMNANLAKFKASELAGSEEGSR